MIHPPRYILLNPWPPAEKSVFNKWTDFFCSFSLSFLSYKELTTLVCVNKELHENLNPINRRWRKRIRKVQNPSYRARKRNANPEQANRVALIGLLLFQDPKRSFSLAIDRISCRQLIPPYGQTKSTAYYALPYVVGCFLDGIDMDAVLDKPLNGKEDVETLRFYMALYDFSAKEKELALLSLACRLDGRPLVWSLIKAGVPVPNQLNVKEILAQERGAILDNFARIKGNEELMAHLLNYNDLTPFNRGIALMRIGLQENAEEKKGLLCRHREPQTSSWLFLSEQVLRRVKRKIDEYIAFGIKPVQVRKTLLYLARYDGDEIMTLAHKVVSSLEQPHLDYLSFNSTFFKNLASKKRGAEILQLLLVSKDISTEVVYDLLTFVMRNRSLKESFFTIICGIREEQREELLYWYAESAENDGIMIALLKEGATSLCKGYLLLDLFDVEAVLELLSLEESGVSVDSKVSEQLLFLGREERLGDELLERGRLPEGLLGITFEELAGREESDESLRKLLRTHQIEGERKGAAFVALAGRWGTEPLMKEWLEQEELSTLAKGEAFLLLCEQREREEMATVLLTHIDGEYRGKGLVRLAQQRDRISMMMKLLQQPEAIPSSYRQEAINFLVDKEFVPGTEAVMRQLLAPGDLGESEV